MKKPSIQSTVEPPKRISINAWFRYIYSVNKKIK